MPPLPFLLPFPGRLAPSRAGSPRGSAIRASLPGLARLTLLALLALPALAPALTPPPLAAASKVPPRAEVRTSGDGLVRVLFVVPEGTVELLLPEGMAAGDTVSGSVRVRASSQRKVEKNLARLGRMTLAAGGLRRPVEGALVGPVAVCRTASDLPVSSCEGGPSSPRLKVTLLDRKDRPLLEALVPVLAEAPPAPERYTYLPLGEARAPFEIRGAFDGDFFTTRVIMGDQRLKPVAESPRRAVLWSPQTVLGATYLEVREGSGAAVSGAMRNLAVLVRFAKPALQTGERTILELQIHGLEDLTAELPLEIVSLTPDAVRLERGPVQPLVIHPREVQGGGVYPWVGTLVGVSPQPFRLEVRPSELRWRALER